MDDAVARHRALVAAGDHLFSQLGFRDLPSPVDQLIIEMDVRPGLCNSRGALQGGLLTTLVDVVAGRLALSQVPEGHGTATADLSCHFLAPIVEGPARAEARIVRIGRRAAVIQVEVHDVGRNRHAATATVSFAVLEPR
jgi:uncharacterized protein (TIGR00369 family)